VIRKIEYRDNQGNPYSYAYTRPVSGTPAPKEIDLNYLEDTEYLMDPENGYIDSNLDPTTKLKSVVKRIERINKATWEFAIADVTRFDSKTIREGAQEAIKTKHDIWGDLTDLIPGIGDFEDLKITSIEQEKNPDVMSKDKFIGNSSGYTIGFSSGQANEIQYTQILNPVNVDNVNNYYPVINHGYFYTGVEEYFMYGNKQTEVLNPENAISGDSGLYYNISGVPNIHSPLILNMIQKDYEDVVANTAVSDFQSYNKNSHRERVDFSPVTPPIEIEHELISSTPFVYIVTDDGELLLPDVEILNKNTISVDVADSEIHGYVNIIRPNKNFRTYTIDVTSGPLTVKHDFGSTQLFAFGVDNSELVLLTNTIIDENNIKIEESDYSGTLVLFNIEDYSTEIELASGFTSGNVVHNLNLNIDINEDIYIDPWVFGVEPNLLLQDELVVVSTSIVDKDTIYVDFGESKDDAKLNIIDFWKLNEADAVFEDKFTLNTDLFSFQETKYWNNEGQATPFHRVYPLSDGVYDGYDIKEYNLRCQTDIIPPSPTDFISGAISGSSLPTNPVYITTNNQIYLPEDVSGTPVLTYEKHKAEFYKFKFRGTDVSPVSWYNEDRIVAIQDIQQEPANIKIYPDTNVVALTSAATRPLMNQVDGVDLVPYNYNVVSGDPINSINITSLTTDNAGVALKDEIIKYSSKRKLYHRDANSREDLEELLYYDIDIIDNTSGLFQLTSGEIDSLFPSGQTINTPSIFDEIHINDYDIDGKDIFDEDGYLFTVKSGIKKYRVPFVGGIFEDNNFTHEVYKSTDIFGSSVVKVGFHNNRRYKTNKKVRITALPSGQAVSSDDRIEDSVIIDVKPITTEANKGSTNVYDIPNTTIGTQQTRPELQYDLVSGNITTFSTAELIDEMYYQELSGSPVTSLDPGGIEDVFDLETKYLVKLDRSYETDVPSGMASGYSAYASGSLLAYDEYDLSAPMFNEGDYYD